MADLTLPTSTDRKCGTAFASVVKYARFLLISLQRVGLEAVAALEKRPHVKWRLSIMLGGHQT